jgi:hypothetical protein
MGSQMPEQVEARFRFSFPVSTGFECHFVERKPNQWVYILQDWDCPVGVDNWQEYATTYGPFRSLEKAHEHLRVNHANPGGWSEFPYSR